MDTSNLSSMSPKEQLKSFVSVFKGGINAFRVFSDRDDVKQTGANGKTFDSNAAIRHGELENNLSFLQSKNKQGCGIFMNINGTDGRGASKKNITHVRAYWVDCDSKLSDPAEEPLTIDRIESLPLKPTMAVQTSSANNFHIYYGLREPISIQSEKDWAEHEAILKSLQQHLAKYGADRKVAEIARCLRVPSFSHNKDKDNPCPVKLVVYNPECLYTQEEILGAFPMQESIFNEITADNANTAAERPKKKQEQPAKQTEPKVKISRELYDRAIAYLATVEGAVSGENGHTKTLETAMKLKTELGIKDKGIAFQLLWKHWNPKCQPLWEESDLRRKVDEAYKIATDKPKTFEMRDNGLCFDGHWVTRRAFRIIGKGRDATGKRSMVAIEANFDGQMRRLDVDFKMTLKASGLAEHFIDAGIDVWNNGAGHLASYVNNAIAPETYLIVDKPNIYKLPNQTMCMVNPSAEIFPPDAPIIPSMNFQASAVADGGPCGSRELDQEALKMCLGNDLLVFIVSWSLAGVYAALADKANAIVHLKSPQTARGKSTILRMGLSRQEANAQLPQWDSTITEIENNCRKRHCHAVFFDDLNTSTDKVVVSKGIYKIGNQIGKSRSIWTADGLASATQFTYVVYVVSSGELGADDVMGGTTSGGQDSRFYSIELPDDPNAVFPCLHGRATAKEFADDLKELNVNNWGFTTRELDSVIIAKINEIGLDIYRELIRTRVSAWAEKIREPLGAVDPGVLKTLDAFGVAAVAGEEAIAFGLLPWPTGTASNAVQNVLSNFLTQRGALDSRLAINVRNRIVETIQLHASYFQFYDYYDLEHDNDVREALGFKDGRELFPRQTIVNMPVCYGYKVPVFVDGQIEHEFWFSSSGLNEALDGIVGKGQGGKLLRQMGWLPPKQYQSQRGEGEKIEVEGKKLHYFVIKPSVYKPHMSKLTA